MDLLPHVNSALFLMGLSHLVVFPSLRTSGSLKFEEEIPHALYGIGIFPLAIGTDYRGDWLTTSEEVLYLTVANVVFLVAVILQFRANGKKSSDDGPTHPKDEPYEGGGQTYPWEDDEQ